ncbi:MAG: glycine zipper 2TM domain-containing protein [Sphingobium sp.]
MSRTFAVAVAASLLAPAMIVPEAADARPRSHKYKKHDRHSHKQWRGRDGRTYCRKSDGTTGLLVGAAGGALLGRTVDTEGDRAMGTILGAAAGGLVGKSIDSGTKCR